MKILWYWPHPHREPNPLVLASLAAGHTCVVQALESYRGERFRVFEEYLVDRSLPDPVPVGGRLRRSAKRVVRPIKATSARRRALGNGFDLVHLENLVLYQDLLDLRMSLKHTRSCAHVHDVWPHQSRLPHLINRKALGQLYRTPSALTVYHPVLRDQLCDQFDIDPQSVFTIPIPIGEPFCSPNEEKRPGPTRLLFLGTIRATKGVALLVKSMEIVGEREDVHLHFAGSGDPNLVNLIQATSARMSNVSAEIGWVSESRKRDLLEWSDWLVMPYESFSSQSGILRDAYEAQRPSIVTDVGAMGPSVRADGTGIVVRPKSIEEVVHAIRSVANTDTATYAEPLRSAAKKHSYHQVGTELAGVHETVGKR